MDVAEIQRALLARGYDLGPSGANGDAAAGGAQAADDDRRRALGCERGLKAAGRPLAPPLRHRPAGRLSRS